MIELDSVTKQYHFRGGTVTAVSAVSMQVAAGEIVGLVGRSGSGKTTLLSMLGGLLQPSSGKIVIDGVNVSEFADAELAVFRNKTIGFIPQGQSLLGSLTVLDNVRLPFFLSPRQGESVCRAESLLDELDMLHLKDRFPHELSGGEMRRTAIARSLLVQPAIILADEPTGDLDQESSSLVLDLFRSAQNKGTTIIFSTHEEGAVQCATKVYTMSKGSIA